MLKKLALVISIFCLSITLNGCFLRPYHIDIQQGNIITPTNARKVKKGMTSEQVQNTLGSPVLKNIYRDNRMVYIYTLELAHKKIHKRYLLIYFSRNRVTHLETDVYSKPPLTFQIDPNHFIDKPPAIH